MVAARQRVPVLAMLGTVAANKLPGDASGSE
jgi:hypothetical protein